MRTTDKRAPYPCETDPDLFHLPENTTPAVRQQITAAKAKCWTCPIRRDCLRAADERKETARAIYGGYVFPRRKPTPPRPVGTVEARRAARAEELAHLTASNMSTQRIAVTLGLTERSVERWKRESREAQAAAHRGRSHARAS